MQRKMINVFDTSSCRQKIEVPFGFAVSDELNDIILPQINFDELNRTESYEETWIIKLSVSRFSIRFLVRFMSALKTTKKVITNTRPFSKQRLPYIAFRKTF